MIAHSPDLEALRLVVAEKQAALGPEADLWDFPEAQRLLALERAENFRRLRAMRPGNRFRLMFGQPLLPEE